MLASVWVFFLFFSFSFFFETGLPSVALTGLELCLDWAGLELRGPPSFAITLGKHSNNVAFPPHEFCATVLQTQNSVTFYCMSCAFICVVSSSLSG